MLIPLALVTRHRSRRLRQALARSSQTLQVTREQLNTLLHRAPVGIAQTGLDGGYLLANDRYCSIVGREEQVLRTLSMHDLTHPEDRARHLEGHAQMLATGEPFVIEKRYVRADQTDIWVISHMSVTHDAHGQPLHVIAAVQDISHRRAADAALRALNATLEQRVADTVAERARVEESLRHAQRMEALGQLAGGVAHDFNNVLQAIAGGARLIQRRPEDPEAVRRLAGLVVDAADRGASVTRRLLSFARRGTLKPGPVDAVALLDDLREMLATTLGARISIRANAPANLPPLMADKGQLETTLVNLATNARDAMLGEDGLPGMGENSITLSATQASGADAGLPARGYIRLDVTDTGPGMDAETLAHATEPFFTTKPRGRGTGLGLATARGFAEQSGGRLELRSVQGQGTTARLWLPIAESAPAAVPEPTRADLPRPDLPRIVLVDDDADVREVLQDTLGSWGCRVFSYPNAAAALAQIEEDQPEVLISDLSMPGTDGLTLIREAQARCRGLPAILLTGYAGRELEAAVSHAKGSRILLLAKPVRGADLAKQVQTLLSPTRQLIPPVPLGESRGEGKG